MNATIEINLNSAELAGLKFLQSEFVNARDALSEAVTDVLLNARVQRATSWQLKDGKMIVTVEVEDGDPPSSLDAVMTEPGLTPEDPPQPPPDDDIDTMPQTE